MGAHNITNAAVGESGAVRMSVAKVINHELFNIVGEKAYDLSLIKLNVSILWKKNNFLVK